MTGCQQHSSVGLRGDSVPPPQGAEQLLPAVDYLRHAATKRERRPPRVEQIIPARDPKQGII